MTLHIKHTKKTTVTLTGRNHVFTYVAGSDDYMNGIRIGEKQRSGSFMPPEAISVRPTEGGPEHWLDCFIEELKRFRDGIIESRERK